MPPHVWNVPTTFPMNRITNQNTSNTAIPNHYSCSCQYSHVEGMAKLGHSLIPVLYLGPYLGQVCLVNPTTIIPLVMYTTPWEE